MSANGLPLPQVVSALLIADTILHALALILTSFRLWFRYQTRRLWWDDFWAILAALCDTVGMVSAWIVNAPLDDPYTTYGTLSIPAQSRSAHIISTWLCVASYTCTIWFARISIVSSVIRIVPPTRTVRMAAVGACVLFFCMWAYIIICKSIACSTNKSWVHATIIECPIPNWVAISEACTDVLSDVILVVLPLRLLWRVKLPSNQKIMVFSVFSASILVSVVSVTHTVYIIAQNTIIGAMTTEIGSATSLVVCNLLVVVTFIYRIMRNGRDLTAGLFDNKADSSTHLTTVDPDFIESSLFTSPTVGTGTGFTGSRFTATNISSVGRDTTFGSIIASSESVHASTSPPLASFTAKQ